MIVEAQDYSRQLKYLLVLGNEILREDGVFREGLFFSKLKQFISFHKEIRLGLAQIIESQRKEEIPINLEGLHTHLKFVNYEYPALPILVLMLAFPFFAIGYFILKYFYVQKTKAKLRVLLQSLSSIQFMVENRK